MWTDARVKSAGFSQADTCQLCGQIDDNLHGAWGGCPVINAADLPAVERTKHLEQRARDQVEQYA